ncbi:MAG: acyl-CoA thioesterase [Planctomycetes bacterium]|nr:acyl-CoA thioesterase [Planctomycetota bacterium]
MTFSRKQTVLFRHCDPARIVFFPRYFEMINDLFEEWLESIGWDFAMLHEERHEGVPTLETSARFVAPCRLGEVLDLSLDVLRVGGASFELSFSAHCGGELRWTAASKLVYVSNDGTTIKSKRIPEPLRQSMLRELQDPENTATE